MQPGFHISILLHFFRSLKKMKSSFKNPTSYQTVNCFLVKPYVFFRALVISSLMDWILNSEVERLANLLNENTPFYSTNFTHVFTKVQIVWEGHKNLTHLFFLHYLVASNYKWKMGQIFVTFSEHLNFTKTQSSTKDSNSIVQHCCQSYTTRCNPLLLYLANKSAKPLLWPPTKSASTFLKIIQHCHAMPLDSSFL